MKNILTLKLKVMIVVCLLILVGGIFPGALSEYIFFTSMVFIVFGIVLIACVVHVIFSIIRQVRKNPAEAKITFYRFIAGIVILVVTAAIASLQVPIRIHFYFCKTSFESVVNRVQTSEHIGCPHTFNKRIGVWHVDRYATDFRGGTYFRIGSGMDGIGPDEMSYGFVFQPNSQGSPFGNKYYAPSHLIGDWYYFEVSNDW